MDTTGLELDRRRRISAESVRDYLAEQESRITRGLDRGLGARLARAVLPFGVRQSAKLYATTLVAPVSLWRARRIARQGGLMLHLGSGIHPLPGWLNVDLVSMNADLAWDLRRGVPFPDGSARAAFLEHVLEHFTLADVLDVLAECRRVLEPGGIIRVGVPDFGRYLVSYADEGSFIEELRPGRPTRLLAVAEVALWHGHRSVWDGETLGRVLTESGFEDVRVCEWGESRLHPAPDAEHRRAESVYAEAVKPR